MTEDSTTTTTFAVLAVFGIAALVILGLLRRRTPQLHRHHHIGVT
jgi:hypothetical protein